jgi:hypothetical protein
MGRIIKFIEGMTLANRSKLLQLILYGGEPLINMKEGFRLLRELDGWSEDQKIKLGVTLDIINISALSKDYSILLKGAIERVRSMGVILRTLFLDREFFNLPAISTPHDMGTDYIMPAKSNQKMDRLLKEHIKKRPSAADRKV